MKKVILFFILSQISLIHYGQIIADHTIVNKYDDIPQYYIDQVKKMWVSYAGESHSQWIQYGLDALETASNIYKVNVTTGGTPEAYTTTHLRASRATWGDVSHASGWIYFYGEEDWFTNETAISRTKAGITYCNTHNLTLSAIGFGWCSDMIRGYTATKPDPVYGVYWRGLSTGGPEDRGDGYGREWGLDADDFPLTLNSISMDTYLNVTQEYIDYCKTNGYPTIVFFTTGPVDAVSYVTVEAAYQGYLKHEHIRDYVKSDSTRILFDYADILCYDDDGTLTTATWNGHTFPVGTTANTGTEEIGHITNKGSLRLAKAMWWMLARIAGWNGEDPYLGITKKRDNSLTIRKIVSENEIKIMLEDDLISWNAGLYDYQGKLLSNIPVNSDLITFNISSLNSGIYFIVLSNGRERHIEKVIYSF